MITPLRRCIFRPYRPGAGPVFTLNTFYAPNPRRNSWGTDGVSYTLDMRAGGRTVRLFAGADFFPGAFVCPDSDDAIRSLMSFLTLRQGDTDEEYFANYTQDQIDFCSNHAEALDCEVMRRFPEEED